MILWEFSVDSSSPEISLETATTVPATVTSSDVPTVVSELMTGNVSSVIDNFTFCIVEGEAGRYEKHSFKN